MEHKANRIYTKAERRSDAAVHFAGLAIVAFAVPALIVEAAQWHGFTGPFLATMIYGICFATMIGCSALYHMTSDPYWKKRFQRLDHTAIYLKIAGTYTPFAILAGPPATWLLFGIWAVALLGMTLKQFPIERFRKLCLILYVTMGWAVVVVGKPLIASMTMPGFILLIVGGLIYSVGVFFYLWKSLNFHNTIWHAHVLVASLLLYAAILIEIRADAVV